MLFGKTNYLLPLALQVPRGEDDEVEVEMAKVVGVVEGVDGCQSVRR